MITCAYCKHEFEGRVLPVHQCHEVEHFGRLGESAEDFEKRRIQGTEYAVVSPPVEGFDRQNDIAEMARGRAGARIHAALHPAQASAGRVERRVSMTDMVSLPPAEYNPELTRRFLERPPLDAPPRSVPQIFDDNAKAEMRELARSVVAELARDLGSAMQDLRQDVLASNELMRHMDVPMEAIADSHERASSSFETLRKDIFKGGLDKLEQVLDTSGLAEAASKSEKRIEAMVNRLEAKIDTAFKAHAEDMKAIVDLLARLQSRELRETKNRMNRAASQAVRRGKKL